MNQLPIPGSSSEIKPAGKHAAAAGGNPAATDSQPFGEMLAKHLGGKDTASSRPLVPKSDGRITAALLKANPEGSPEEAVAVLPGLDATTAPINGADLLAALPGIPPTALPANELPPQSTAGGPANRRAHDIGERKMRETEDPSGPLARSDEPGQARNEKTAIHISLLADTLAAGRGADPGDIAARMTADTRTVATVQQPLPLSAAAAPLPMQIPGTVAPSPQTTVATALTHDRWADDFSQKVTWLATQNQQRAELHLNPPNLGPLEVSLRLNGDQATALFSSPHAAVREAIEQSIPKLREMFADNGIMLGGTTVSDQSRHEQHSESGPRHPAGHGIRPEETAGTAGMQHLPPTRLHNGMVDTFA